MKSLPLNNNKSQALVLIYGLRYSSLAVNTSIFLTCCEEDGKKTRNRWLVCILTSQLAFSLPPPKCSSLTVIIKCRDNLLEMILLGSVMNWCHRSGFNPSKAKLKMSVLHKPVWQSLCSSAVLKTLSPRSLNSQFLWGAYGNEAEIRNCQRWSSVTRSSVLPCVRSRSGLACSRARG